jgi:hypothetical protein
MPEKEETKTGPHSFCPARGATASTAALCEPQSWTSDHKRSFETKNAGKSNENKTKHK